MSLLIFLLEGGVWVVVVSGLELRVRKQLGA